VDAPVGYAAALVARGRASVAKTTGFTAP
jgi:hypothetical protein